MMAMIKETKELGSKNIAATLKLSITWLAIQNLDHDTSFSTIMYWTTSSSISIITAIGMTIIGFMCPIDSRLAFMKILTL